MGRESSTELSRGGFARGKSRSAAQRPRRHRLATLACCTLLAAGVTVVFAQTVRHQFVNYDDDKYIYQNQNIKEGVTPASIGWAFRERYEGNWTPLTWLSHMLDWQFFRDRAGGHHLTNVLLHGATSVLLLLALGRMTGRFWPSVFAAALFAVHPLRAESVAWVAERKDVLSGLFFVLALVAYAGYARRRGISTAFVVPPSGGRAAQTTGGMTYPAAACYLALMIFFALGLMAKPVVVTLPFVLLLLDYWPLGRVIATKPRALPAIVIEKLPLLAMMAAACAVAVWAQGAGLEPNQRWSLPWRVGNAVIAYVFYLVRLFYPVDLAAHYPRLVELPLWMVAGSMAVLAGITAAASVTWRRCPYLLVGWFWYLGMMLPVIGLVQFGVQAVADRFTYLAQIGVYMALAWGAADLVRAWRVRRGSFSLGVAATMAVLVALAWWQTSFWYDSEMLWTHVLRCTADDALAHNDLAMALTDQFHLVTATTNAPRSEEATREREAAAKRLLDSSIVHYRRAVELDPRYFFALNNLGYALVTRGQIDEGIAFYRRAISVQPDEFGARCNLASALLTRGDTSGAEEQCNRALQLNPRCGVAHFYLGTICDARHQWQQALEHFTAALRGNPADVDARCRLAILLARLDRRDEAIAQYRVVLRFAPRLATVHNDLGVVLVASGRLNEAIEEYRTAIAIAPNFAIARKNLDLALAKRRALDMPPVRP
jgi:protein O-mannosyl-transferase